MARFNLILQHDRDNSEILGQMKALMKDGKLPPGTLMKSQDELKNDVEAFLKLKQLD